MSSVVRIPTDVHREVKKLAELQSTQPGEVLALAWREYVSNHREEFAAELEEVARLLREGDVEDLAAFASRTASVRAEAAAARGRSPE
jgi:prephenate dehydrogenase